MSVLKISDLHVRTGRHEILRGVDLEVGSGEVHALMGPNGSGKSTLAHALLGRDDYEVTSGSVTIDGEDLLALPTWERARRGLFLAMQYPVEVPGVPLAAVVGAARDGDLSGVGLRAARIGVPAGAAARRERRLGARRRAGPSAAVLRARSRCSTRSTPGRRRRGSDVARTSPRSRDDRIRVLASRTARLLEAAPDRVHVFLAGRIVRAAPSCRRARTAPDTVDACRARPRRAHPSSPAPARPLSGRPRCPTPSPIPSRADVPNRSYRTGAPACTGSMTATDVSLQVAAYKPWRVKPPTSPGSAPLSGASGLAFQPHRVGVRCASTSA